MIRWGKTGKEQSSSCRDCVLSTTMTEFDSDNVVVLPRMKSLGVIIADIDTLAPAGGGR